jgi:hypothetical protein
LIRGLFYPVFVELTILIVLVTVSNLTVRFAAVEKAAVRFFLSVGAKMIKEFVQIAKN